MQEENVNKIVGQRLREIRVAHKLSQQTVGKVLSVNQAAIYKYETGKVPLTPPDLLKLARFFHKPVEWFYGIDENPAFKIEIGGEANNLQDLLANVPADELIKALAKQMGIPEKAARGMYLALQAAKETDEDAAGKV